MGINIQNELINVSMKKTLESEVYNENARIIMYQHFVIIGLNAISSDDWMDYYLDGGAEYLIMQGDDDLPFFHARKRISKGFKNINLIFRSLPENAGVIATCETRTCDMLSTIEKFKHDEMNYLIEKLPRLAASNFMFEQLSTVTKHYIKLIT